MCNKLALLCWHKQSPCQSIPTLSLQLQLLLWSRPLKKPSKQTAEDGNSFTFLIWNTIKLTLSTHLTAAHLWIPSQFLRVSQILGYPTLYTIHHTFSISSHTLCTSRKQWKSLWVFFHNARYLLSPNIQLKIPRWNGAGLYCVCSSVAYMFSFSAEPSIPPNFLFLPHQNYQFAVTLHLPYSAHESHQ